MFHQEGLSASVIATIKDREAKVKGACYEAAAIVEDWRALFVRWIPECSGFIPAGNSSHIIVQFRDLGKVTKRGRRKSGKPPDILQAGIACPSGDPQVGCQIRKRFIEHEAQDIEKEVPAAPSYQEPWERDPCEADL